jgi:hypothetical protein
MRKQNSGGHAHLVAVHRGDAAVSNHGVGEDASGHGTSDVDVFLPGRAGRGNLPAEQFA